MPSWSVLQNCLMIISLSAACALKVNCGRLVLELYGPLIEQRRQSASLFLTEERPDSQNMQKALAPQKEYKESRVVWEEGVKLILLCHSLSGLLSCKLRLA